MKRQAGGERSLMTVESCIPVIPSADLEKSLRFWVEGLGLTVEREMRQKGRLIGCIVHNGGHLYFWLNQRAGTPVKPEDYEGIRLYWAPSNIHEARERLKQLGYLVSDIVDRDYGQTEFFVTDDDGFSHCFGLPNTGTRSWRTPTGSGQAASPRKRKPSPRSRSPGSPSSGSRGLR